MIKNLFSVFVFITVCSFSFAQQPDQSPETARNPDQERREAQEKAQANAARASAGCGPSETQFDVKTDKSQHLSAQPEPDKSLVYVFEDETRQPNTFNIGSVTTRVGLDGKWVGANHGKSYFFFFVSPGEHRLCAEWQSSFKRFSKLGSATSFTTEAGKTYYFRTEIEEREKYPAAVKLELVNSAEGQFLISGGALSKSRVKPMEPPEEQ
jgi:hypothetical protein